jgi:hypothetical protein
MIAHSVAYDKTNEIKCSTKIPPKEEIDQIPGPALA